MSKKYKGQGIHQNSNGIWECPRVIGYNETYYIFDDMVWEKHEIDDLRVDRIVGSGRVEEIIKRPDIVYGKKDVYEVKVEKIGESSFTRNPIFSIVSWYFIVDKPTFIEKYNEFMSKINVEKPVILGLSLDEIIEGIIKLTS